MRRLHQLSVGESAPITCLDEGAHCYQRFLELGFTQGEEVRVLRKAPLGGPLHIEIRESQYAICRSDAQFIRVAV